MAENTDSTSVAEQPRRQANCTPQWGFDVSDAVRELLERIEWLPEEDRLVLEHRLAELAEADWTREAEQARQLARERGLDHATIDKAIHDLRDPS
jgi:hypothetical protein